MVVLMAISRDRLYQQFGPMLIEAIARVMLDEINDIRELNAMPTRTTQQLMNAVTSKLAGLTKYDWMDREDVT